MIDQKIEAYCEEHTSPEDAVLYELYRQTHLQQVLPRMASGRIQGRLLEFVSRMIHPEKILEIGTFTGYSAICLARGLRPDGVLTTIDCDPEIEDFARKYIQKAGLEQQIDFRLGDAMKMIPHLEGQFDLVFIDADKSRYPEYYQLLIEKLRPGGYLLADNVLWDGKVVDTHAKSSKELDGIMAFNRMVQADCQVENVLIPLRDGLMLVQKKE